MLKKLLVSVLVLATFFVPTLGFSYGVPMAGAGSNMALLNAAVDGDAAFEAEVLSSDEMQTVEGARRLRLKKPDWIKVYVALVVICAMVTGGQCAVALG